VRGSGTHNAPHTHTHNNGAMAETKEVGNASVPRSPSVAVSGTNAPVDIGVQRMVSPLWPPHTSYELVHPSSASLHGLLRLSLRVRQFVTHCCATPPHHRLSRAHRHPSGEPVGERVPRREDGGRCGKIAWCWTFTRGANEDTNEVVERGGRYMGGTKARCDTSRVFNDVCVCHPPNTHPRPTLPPPAPPHARMNAFERKSRAVAMACMARGRGWCASRSRTQQMRFA
jgi:hypothetical protein